MSKTDDFFQGKRTWSLIKDSVLRDYMRPYLAKVNRRRQPILLVDCYAGPGIFDDGTEGSPLIMCQEADRIVGGSYSAIFVNKDPSHHAQLTSALRERHLLGIAHPILGDANTLLASLPSNLGTQTVFLYLDPFGLSGCEFDRLRPFFARDSRLSTEIVFLMHMPPVHRLAMTQKQREGRRNHPLATAFHGRLTSVFGGDYWKPILWNTEGSPEDHEWKLIEAYAKRIRAFLPYTYFCPVREDPYARIKYFIMFASHHEDAMLLMNDIMAKAYHGHMHRQRNIGTLWEMQDWREARPINDLDDEIDQIIVDALTRWPNLTRNQLWAKIVSEHFMEYSKTEYLQALTELASKDAIIYLPDPATKRRNDNSLILPSI